MIFGFGRKQEEDFEEEVELILFQGALNGKDANLKANARLAEAGLVPAKELVTDALLRRADTIRIEPKGERSTVNLLIDGIPYSGGRLSKQQGLAVTQIMKLLAGLDPKQRQKTQSGGLRAELEEVPYELRIESVPLKTGGERLTIRALNLKAPLNTPEELGFPEEMKNKLREMTAHRKGVVVACGPPRSGTTTTAYGVLRSVDAYLYSIYSIADVGNRPLVNITPFEALEGDGLDETITRCKRVEADVIFLDPIRDEETAQIIFRHQESVAIITEMTAKDAAWGVAQLVKWVGDAKKVASGLQGAVSQKLVRILCPECREAYRPNPKLLAKVGLPKETKVLYRVPKPDPETGRPAAVDSCDHCGGTGYYGRAAMFELIEMTDSMRELVASKAAPDDIKAQARKEKMMTLQKDGLRLVAEGKTSLEELQRVFKAG